MKSFFHFITLICITCTIASFAQESFPSRDSKEWNDLTVAERWQAMNIPEDQLAMMSTNELIEHCINFDFMWDLFNYSNYSTGLNVVFKCHNGLRELLCRKDAGELILNYYKKIDVSKISEINKVIDKGEFVGRIFFLELFLSHENILLQLKDKETDLIKAVLQTYDDCLVINSGGQKYFSGYAIATKVLVMGKVLNQLKGKRNDIAFEDMDIGKLKIDDYKEIIEEARKL